MTEAKGAEGRGSYFNGVGAIRDVMQNREIVKPQQWAKSLTRSEDMTQVLALLTMERPKSFAADDLCKEKVMQMTVEVQ